MNAVERLLAHAEQALRFFGDVYREADLEGPLWDAAEPVARQVVELLDRDAGWQGWQSRAFLLLAVLRSLDAEPASIRPAEALRLYRKLLAERRRLLSPKRLRALLAEAVAASAAWGPLTRDVVRRAEAAGDALARLRSIPGDSEPEGSEQLTFGRWHVLRLPLRRAIDRLDRLRALGQQPVAVAPSCGRKPGRPKQADERKQRELVEGWLTFEQQYRGDGRPTKRQYIAERYRGQRKGTAEQAALEARSLRDLETALAIRRRKRQQLRAARTK